MALPVLYSVRSTLLRFRSHFVAALSVAGSVAVFVAMLALANGFRATLVRSGSPANAMVRRAGSTAELESAVSREEVRVVADAPGVARDAQGPLVSPEVLVVVNLPLAKTGTDANVQMRGVSARALAVRPQVKVISGRWLRPGRAEVIAGKNAAVAYRGLSLGSSVTFAGQRFSVVGIFDAGGSAFDSEIWADATLLNAVFDRPAGVFQSVTVRLTDPVAFGQFKESVERDPRLRVQAEREVDYYRKNSQAVANMIEILGTLVALIMGIGAVFAGFNSMYSALASRTRELATLRALGFTGGTVVVLFLLEACAVALVGGVLGAVAVLPLNGFTTSTMNWQTFSHLSFAFRVTPRLAAAGVFFALVLGVASGLVPAIRAARLPVAQALREL